MMRTAPTIRLSMRENVSGMRARACLQLVWKKLGGLAFSRLTSARPPFVAAAYARASFPKVSALENVGVEERGEREKSPPSPSPRGSSPAL